MLNRLLILLNIFILGLFTHTYSQRPDFIVTQKNDTIYGFIKLMLGEPYKIFNDDHAYEIRPGDIISYYLAERKQLYRRKMLPGKKKFYMLACLELGLINLYIERNDNPAGKTNAVFYAEKEKDTLVEVWTNKGMFGNSNKTPKEAFAELIKDNAPLKQAFDNEKKYEAIVVQYYIHEYNKGLQPN